MRCVLLLLCAGISAAAFIVDISAALTFSICSVGLLLVSLFIAELRQVREWLRRLLLAALCFAIGFCWHAIWASNRLAQRLPTHLEGETIQVEGVVSGLPERSAIAQQFQFNILQAPSGFFPRKVVLNYYGAAEIEPGQHWRFTVRLNRPHGFANPGGFDYESWLFQRGISARGYVRDSTLNHQLTSAESQSGSLFSVGLHSLRFSLRTRLQKLSADLPYSGLLIALLLGDRSAISQENWQLFTATGSNHLFVISGLHIGMVSGFAFWVALLIGRIAGIVRIWPAQKFAGLLALCAAFCYALLAGFSLPTQRAFIMIAVLAIGVFWSARYQISFRLLVAASFVLLLNPLAMTSSGFWLSFTAVAALFAFAGKSQPSVNVGEMEISNRGRLKALAELLVRPQLVVFLALSAPLIFFTQQLSLLAPLVNMIAIPAVGILVLPLCFTALILSVVSVVASSFLLSIADSIISLLIAFMSILVEWGTGELQLQIAQPNSWNLFVLVLALLLLLLPKGVCRKSLALPLLLCLLPLPRYLESAEVIPANLRVHILDVGQGLAVIVQTRNHVLLYDTGANLSPDFNIGAAVVVPALRALDIDSLSAVVISHGDNDHAGGLRGVEPSFEIVRLFSNSKALAAKQAVVPCTDNNAWNWDGVEFRFLESGLDSSSENNSSCVLQILSEAGTILLPGDIEREAEVLLAIKYGAQLSSDVLLAPHHGSQSSSSYAFLKRVQPRFVVFSAGYRNSFGHPHDVVLARYGEFASRALTTAETGMVSFEFRETCAANLEPTQSCIQAREYRRQISRYWY